MRVGSKTVKESDFLRNFLHMRSFSSGVLKFLLPSVWEIWPSRNNWWIWHFRTFLEVSFTKVCLSHAFITSYRQLVKTVVDGLTFQPIWESFFRLVWASFHWNVQKYYLNGVGMTNKGNRQCIFQECDQYDGDISWFHFEALAVFKYAWVHAA